MCGVQCAVCSVKMTCEVLPIRIKPRCDRADDHHHPEKEGGDVVELAVRVEGGAEAIVDHRRR